MTHSAKTKLRRLPERSVDDMSEIYEILDEGFLCHVAYINEQRPVVIPTLYARDGDRILLHGSTSSGIVRAVRAGSPLSVAVTHVDGLVVARTGFHSSANYRSVVIHGVGRLLDGEEHAKALDIVVNTLYPGRLEDIRENHEIEIRQSASVELKLDEISAKMRTGPPKDDDEDLGTGVWAGVIPVSLMFGTPVPAPDLEDGVEIPDYLDGYQR